MDETDFVLRIAQLPQSDDKTDAHILQARKKYVRSHIAWCDAEDTILQEMLACGYSRVSLAELLSRSIGAIVARIKSLDKSGHAENNCTIPEMTHDVLGHDQSQNVTKSVLRYWRNSLADAERRGLSVDKVRAGKPFSLSELDSGRLPLLDRGIEDFFC